MGGNIKKSEKTESLEKSSSHLKTATKVYVNLAEPERAKEISKLNLVKRFVLNSSKLKIFFVI